jgi:hypothetical protein
MSNQPVEQELIDNVRKQSHQFATPVYALFTIMNSTAKYPQNKDKNTNEIHRYLHHLQQIKNYPEFPYELRKSLKDGLRQILSYHDINNLLSEDAIACMTLLSVCVVDSNCQATAMADRPCERLTVEQSPGSIKESPESINVSPETIKESPETIKASPVSIKESQITKNISSYSSLIGLVYMISLGISFSQVL